MDGKTIFFGLCVSMIIASEVSAMQLVTKRMPKSVHRVNVTSPMIQKRNFDEAGEIVAAAMFILPLGYALGQVATVAGCYIIGGACKGVHKTYKYVRDPKAFRAEKLYYDIAEIGSDECSFAYIKKIPCSNPRCCKYLDLYDAQKKRVELFSDANQEHHFVMTVNAGLQKLQSKEEEGKLLWAHDKITAEQCKKIAGLLRHKKDCYIKQRALFEEYNKNKE